MNNEHETGQIAETVPLRPRPTTTKPVSGAARPGDRIGRYSVLEFLGKGGMGEVYTAYDPKLDRRVALKIIHSRMRIGSDSEAAQATLLDEARTLARVSHPNVIAIYDADALGDDVYVTMELVEGATLREWLADTDRSRDEILEVFRAAAAGLSAAHDAELVHRDVKPENILIGDDSRVRLIDFGIAQLVSESRGERDDSPVIGTPAYMAPEQKANGHVDARSDQYSLCVALAEALIGERLDDPDSRRRAVAESGLPSWLGKALSTGLADSADDRFETVEQLSKAITPPPPVRRSIGLLAVAGGAVAATAIAFSIVGNEDERSNTCDAAADEVATLWSEATRKAMLDAFVSVEAELGPRVFTTASRAIDRYALAWRRARISACRAASNGELSPPLSEKRVACLNQRLGELRAVITVLSAADSSLVDNAVRTVESLSPIGRCQRVTGAGGIVLDSSLEAALSQLKALERSGRFDEGSRAADKLAGEMKDTSPVGYARAMTWRGRLESQLGKFKDAEATLFEAARLAELAGDSYTRAEAWSYIVWVVGVSQRRRHEGLRFSKQAEVAIRNAGAPLDVESKRVYHEGMILRGLQRYEDALVNFQRSALLAREAWGERSWEHMLSRMGQAMTLRDLERLDEAVEIYDEVLVAMTEQLGDENPRLAVVHGNIAKVLAALRRYDEARVHYVRSRELKVKKLGPNHPSIQITDHNMAILAERLGDFEAAERGLEAVHRARVDRDGAKYRKLAMSLESRGRVAQKRGDLERAAKLQRQSVAEYAAKGPDAREDVAYALAELCDTLRLAKRFREAQVECRKAVEMLSKSASDPRNLATALTSAAHLALDQGRLEAARKLIDRAHEIRTEHESDAADRVRTDYVRAAVMPARERAAAATLAAKVARDIESLHVGDQQLKQPAQALARRLREN